MLITSATLSNRLHVKQRTRGERPTFSPFVVPLFHRTFGSEQATLKNIERMHKSERIRRSFFFNIFFTSSLYANCSICWGMPSIYVCLVQLYVWSLMNGWEILLLQSLLNAFIASPLVGKPSTINNLFALLFVNYIIRRSLSFWSPYLAVKRRFLKRNRTPLKCTSIVTS